MAQEPTDHLQRLAAAVDQFDSVDDPAPALLDHSHRGLPSPGEEIRRYRQDRSAGCVRLLLSPGADPLSSTSITTSLITSCHRRFLVISGSSATRWNVATVANSLAVRPSGGARTWTVVGEGYQTVIPVEDWLEAHRYLWSPNTVRGYATSLAQWWTFLEQRREAERWNEVGVPAVSGFLSWLRNGRTVEHALGPAEGGPAPETLQARLAALISFYRWHEAVFGVPVAGRLLHGAPRRAPARGLLAHLDARSAPGPSSLVRVRRRDVGGLGGGGLAAAGEPAAAAVPGRVGCGDGP